MCIPKSFTEGKMNLHCKTNPNTNWTLNMTDVANYVYIEQLKSWQVLG